MMRRSYRPEQIIKKLREAEILFSQGSKVGETARKIGVTEQTHYRWCREYGGMRIEQVKRLGKVPGRRIPALRDSRQIFREDNAVLKEALLGKLLSPSKRRKMVGTVLKTLKVSGRRACRVLGQARTIHSVTAHTPKMRGKVRSSRIIELRTRYVRYGYHRITALLNQEGWKVNHKRIERTWRREGLKISQKQAKRGRLWLDDGSCIGAQDLECKDHVWIYDLMVARTADERDQDTHYHR